MAFLRSIATIGSYTMLSRLTGFARDMLVAALLGAGPVADAFFVAFKLPNFFRRLFAEGAFNSAFVPIFAGALEEGRAAARAFAEDTLAILTLVLLVFTIACQVFMPWIMHVLAPGFADDPGKFALAVEMARITFPYLLFVSLSSQLSGVLNSLGRFAVAAAAPIILNLSMIATLLLLARYTATPGHALAWGVALAGVLQFAMLMWACHAAGFAPRMPWPRLTPRAKTMLKRMVPGAIGAGGVQVNLVVDVVIASFLPTGAISFLYYADRLNQLPLGVVGVAVSTALLPVLSRDLARGDASAADEKLNRAIELAWLLTVPAACALAVLAIPIVSVLFERGAFGHDATQKTAAALAAYAAGLPAYVLVKVFGPPFFARGDTVTPVKIALIAIAVNTALAIALAFPLAHVGVALATAIAAWGNAGMLLATLMRRGFYAVDGRLKRRLPRIIVASAAMTAVLYGVALIAPGGRIVALAILVVAGGLAFALAALACGAAELGELKRLVRKPTGTSS